MWHKKIGGKLFNIITLAFHLRQFDIIIANNPPMQIVAALAKLFSQNNVRTLWWHHHVPWYLPKEANNGDTSLSIRAKSVIERYCIVPCIDQMIATSHFVAEKIQEYCGRESVVVHPVIQAITTIPLPSTKISSPLKGALDADTVPVPLSRGEESQNEQGGMYQKSGYGEYNYPANTKLQSFSHQMSREMTRAEQRLWFEVLQSGKTGYKWVKQKIIGNFIVDFYCHEKRLVIEVDGGVHHDQWDYDVSRTKYLEKLGIRVMRYTNELVLNQINQVREKILWEMEHEPVPLSRGKEIQHEKGGMQPDTIPLPSTKISSPLKGALGTGSSDTDTVTLFTHGRLEVGKGLDVLVKTFHAMTNDE